MKLGCRLLFLFVVLFVLHSLAVAADYEVAKIYPKTGQPMVVKNFHVPWHGVVKGIWNKTRIEIPTQNIKSIKILGVYDDYNAELEVELTTRNGKKQILRIEKGAGPYTGDTDFGRIKIYPKEMVFLDLYPDLSNPDPPMQAPAGSPPHGKVIDPTQ
jgi:hypothetical protein